MAKLTFKRFRCDIDTDETGGESTMRNTLTGEVRKHLDHPSGDQDDLMEEDNYRAARKLSISNSAGASPKLIFKGDTGKYEAEFVVA